MTIANNIKKLQDDIADIKSRLGLDYNIDIVAVTKTYPAQVIKESVAAGIVHIGENRVQEANTKFAELEDLSFTKHLIGPLQKNKANKAAEIFDFIESIENIDVATKLNTKLQLLDKTMPILIEIKTSDEATKFGISSNRLSDFVGQINELSNLQIKGLMTIAPFTGIENDIRKSFSNLYHLCENIKTEYRNIDFATLSMGMSGDYRLAIEEGSTMIRVGSLLFGRRDISPTA